MKRNMVTLVLALFATGIAACDSNRATSAVVANEIVGMWISNGPEGAQRVHVTFDAPNLYAVVVTDTVGVVADYTGTWTVARVTGPLREIALRQNAPTTENYRGVFRVSGDSLTLEIGSGVPSQHFSRTDVPVSVIECSAASSVTGKRSCEAGWNPNQGKQ